ncbi:MAG: alpha/beta fold hydrolase [Psychrobium sp.]
MKNILIVSLITLLFSIPNYTFANEKKPPYGDGEIFKGQYGNLYFESEGRGTPVVIINGGPGAGHSVFLGWFEFLTKQHYQVVYFDETGRGRATREVANKPLSPQMGVNDLESLRQHLKAEKIIIIAHSYGGIQGMQYALQYPKHVEKLIMVNASYDAQSQQMNIDNVKRVTQHQYPQRWQQVLKLRQQGIKSSDERYYDLLSTGPDMYWYNTENRKKLRRVRTNDKRDRFNMQAYFDIVGDDPEWTVDGTLKGITIEQELKGFTIPTLLIAGRFDKITSPKMVYRLGQMMNNSTTQQVMFEKSGHWPWVEENEKFEKVISEFLK